MRTKCCICGKPYEGWGNNPEGAAARLPDGTVKLYEKFGIADRCCNECDRKYVIPGRIYRLKLREAMTHNQNKKIDE